MKKRTLSLFGYVYRMNNKGLIKIVVTGMASGKKRRGRLFNGFNFLLNGENSSS